MSSAATASEISAYRAGLTRLLDSLRIDPEELLEDLGFAGSDASLFGKLPGRFLTTTQRDRALLENFHAQHPEFMRSQEAEALAGEQL